MSSEDNNKLTKSLQLLDETEEKEVIIKVKNKNAILNDKDIKDTVHPKLVKARLKGKKLVQLIKDNNIELIEEDVDVNLTGEIIPYGVTYTNAPSVWNKTTGKGIKVAVLDTGISQHDDLVIAGGISIIDTDYSDNVNHGTPVAGVIASVINEQGITGVSPDISLYAVKIMDSTTGKISDAIAGLQWAIDNNMDIVVMSFGTPVNSQIFKEVLQEAYNNGILLVAAGGNNGQILYPAKYSSVIAVGSIDEYNQSLTPQGFELELVAGGDNIYTTTNNNGYDYFSGTSLAAPHVAGIAALLKSYHNDLTNKQIRGKLQNDAVDLGKHDLYGFGLGQVNLESNNYDLFEFQYNYTVYKYENETTILYAEGFGNLDDVDFEEGRYQVLKRFNNRNYYEEIVVSEDGIIQVLLADIQFDDNWVPYEGGSSSDGKAFVGTTTFREKLINPNSGIMVECFNTDTDSNYEDCYANTQADLDSCKSVPGEIGDDLTNICNSADCSGTDNIYSGAVGGWHSISTSSEVGVTGTDVHYFGNCNGAAYSTYSDQNNDFYVYDRRKIVCEVDNEREYQGRDDSFTNHYFRYLQNVACPSGKVCDPALDENYTTSATAQISDVCRVADGGACSTANDCLTNHYCVGSVCTANDPSTYCNGSFEINVDDSAGTPMSGMYVYLNGINNGTTDNNGFKKITFTNVLCDINQNLSIRCYNDQSRACGNSSNSINYDGDIDFFNFNCNVCRNSANLKIALGNINLIQTSKNNFDIIANVSSENVQANNVIVSYIPLNKNTGLIEYNQAKNGSINLVSSDTFKTASVNMNLDNIDYVYIQVDPNKQVNEDKKDNFVIVPVIKKKEKAQLIVNTSNSKADEAIREYLRLFVNETDTNPDFIINIGIPSTTKKGKEWSYENHALKFNMQTVEYWPHVGIVAKEDNQIYVFGNEIEGTVAAVKRLINARNIFFNKNVKTKAILLDKYDTLGISVLDLMHNPEKKPFRDTETDDFKKIVTDILNDNNFELAIKTVKTTNDNTTLRLKNLNSDFSDKFKDAIINNSKPVVFAGGLFSDLFRWEEDNGLAKQMVQEGRDSWEIEITGGPGQDCPTCPNYKYEDLVDYYWPALIAGVVEYSGKTKIDYVGHSNGCRTALSSLKNWSVTGKNNAGNCFNLQTGLYDIQCDLPSNPVDTFVGLGCPGTLNGSSHVITQSLKNGDSVLLTLKNNNISHLSGREFAKRLNLDYSSFWPEYKISLNLASFYNNIIKISNDSIPSEGLFINNVYLIAGEDSISEWGKHDGDDGIVPLEDPISINSSFNYTNGELIIVTEPHHILPDKDEIHDYIKRKLIR